MPFSLTSYLLGVGTVVGALAFGFGGGVVLTKTAMKETAAGPTRIERVARSEPEPTAAVPQDAKNNLSRPAEPVPAAGPGPTPAAQGTDPATQVAMQQPDTRTETESAKQPEPATRQPEPTKQAEPATQTEQKDATQKRAAERKAERRKHYADRNARSFAASRTRQPPSEEQDKPERTELVFSREEPHFFGREEPHGERHFNLFQMLSPPPLDRSYDRDD
jgi:hypothetical protein